MTITLNQLVEIQTGQAAIVLESGLAERNLIRTYTPTKSAVTVLEKVLQAVNPSAAKELRALNWYGTYGAGKSRLAVLVGQMLRDGVANPDFEVFLGKLAGSGEHKLADALRNWFMDSADEDARPYLIVPLYGNQSNSLQAALVEALYAALNDHADLSPAEILPDTEFDVVIKRLDEILLINQQLKDDFLPNRGLGNDYLTVEYMRKGLENYEEKALKVFSGWHEQVCLGSVFNPAAYGGANFIEIYQEAAKRLCAKKFKGVAVIWDEFGNALEDLLKNPHRSPNKEVIELQKFVETVCEPAQGHVLFIGLTHVSLAEYGPRSNVAEDLRQRLATIEGRFTCVRVELKAAEAEGYHLLGAQVSPTERGLAALAKNATNADQVVSSCRALPLFSHLGAEVEYIAKNCYPLHPVASAALLSLSAQYAQATRTAFTFFGELLQSGALSSRPADENNLFTNELIRFPDLIDYYAERISQTTDSDKLELFKRNCALCSDANADPVMVLERKNVLAVLMLASLLSEGFQANDHFLAAVLHDAEFEAKASETLRQALAWLTQAGLIWKNDTTGFWAMGGDTGTNPEVLINDALLKVPEVSPAAYFVKYPEVAADLLPMLGIHDLDPSPAGVVRSYAVKALPVNELDRVKIEAELAAQVVIVLSETAEAAEAAKSTILGKNSANIFYWISHEGTAPLGPKLRRYIALSAVLQQSLSDGLRMQLNAKLDHTRNELLRMLGVLFGREGLSRSTTQILQQGEHLPVQANSWHSFRSKLQSLIDASYNKELLVRVAQLERNRTQSKRTADSKQTMDIVARVFEFDHNPAYQDDLLGYADTSEDGAVVDGILKGFFIKRVSGWGFRRIDELEGASLEVVQTIKSDVLKRREKPYLMTDLSAKLSAAPYGIPPGALPLIAAYALREDIQKINWVTKKTLTLAEGLCKSLIDSQVSVRFSDFAQKHLNILEVLQNALSNVGAGADWKGDKHEKGRLAIAALKEYIKGFPEVVTTSPRLDKKARELMEAVNAVAKTAHEIADKIAELIDPSGLLNTASPDAHEKIAARDRLESVLNEFERIQDAKVIDVIDELKRLIPDVLLERKGIIEALSSSGGLGEQIAELIEYKAIERYLAEKIVYVVTDKSIGQCSDLEIGKVVGRIALLIENGKEKLRQPSGNNHGEGEAGGGNGGDGGSDSEGGMDGVGPKPDPVAPDEETVKLFISLKALIGSEPYASSPRNKVVAALGKLIREMAQG